MTLIDFKKVIESIDLVNDFVDKTYEMGIDLSDSAIYNYFGVLIDILWRSCYTDDGVDIINLYIYDKVRELHQSENNNFVSLNNKEELYNFVESNYKRNE